MAVAGWIVDKSAIARAEDPIVGGQLAELAGDLFVCSVGELEQLYSARSSREYDALKELIRGSFGLVPAPSDILDRALDGSPRCAPSPSGVWPEPRTGTVRQ